MNFNDVDGGAYYAEAVRWAASEKIVEGTTATTFAPDAAVTRAQVVTMLYRFAEAQGMDTAQGGMAIREFNDFDTVPAYALEAMDWAVNAGGSRATTTASCRKTPARERRSSPSCGERAASKHGQIKKRPTGCPVGLSDRCKDKVETL